MVEVNLYLAVVIFFSALLTKVLHKLRSPLADLIADLFSNGSASQTRNSLKLEILQLKEEVKNQENFEKRVNLVNKRLTKENLLRQINKQSDEKLFKTKRICKIILFILIEGSRISVIFLNRTRPVFIFSPNLFWPLAQFLSYPTGITGAVSPLVWGVACRQFFQHFLLVYDKNQ